MFFGVVHGRVFQIKNALYIYLIKLLSKQIEIVLKHSKINSRSTSQGKYSAIIIDLQSRREVVDLLFSM